MSHNHTLLAAMFALLGEADAKLENAVAEGGGDSVCIAASQNEEDIAAANRQQTLDS